MTLRVRLLALTLSMVTVVALTLIALNLNSLTDNALESAVGSSEMAAQQVQSFIRRRLSETYAQESPLSVEETKRIWRETAADDPEIAAVLEQTMAQSRSIVEIDVAGEDGVIVASSSPREPGVAMQNHPDLRALRDAGPIERISAILTSHNDYETRVPLGIAGQKTPIFTVQILVSPVLLRAIAYPQMNNTLTASGIAMALAFVLAYWAAQMALRPLARISHLIDDIVAGQKTQGPPSIRVDEARELAAIESKLSMLSERYRDAREDASQLRSSLKGVLEKLDARTRRHFEDKIGLAERLTAINSLTGRVAHEIKNPLNSIALRLEMVRSRVAEQSPDIEGEFAILSEEITRLDRVVRTFLDFNRPLDLAMVDLDIGAELSELLRVMEPQAQEAAVAISCRFPSEPVMVRGDAGLLRQALLNIVVNAIEAMPQGGRLSIAIAKEADTCSIRIADTGPGIAPEQLDKIFQLYFTTKPRGSGIGLAMTCRAVHLHAGTIEVESHAGEGTVFQITLPLAGMDKAA